MFAYILYCSCRKKSNRLENRINIYNNIFTLWEVETCTIYVHTVGKLDSYKSTVGSYAILFYIYLRIQEVVWPLRDPYCVCLLSDNIWSQCHTQKVDCNIIYFFCYLYFDNWKFLLGCILKDWWLDWWHRRRDLSVTGFFFFLMKAIILPRISQ